MNFFESQDHARTSTKRLIVYFVLAVVTLVCITNVSIMGVFMYFELGTRPLTWNFIKQSFDWELFGWLSIGVVGVIAAGSIYKRAELSAGGKVIAAALGGEKVEHGTKNLQQQTLLNVVEEMAIAAGTPVPPVYLLKNEYGINAFAAGYTVDDAVIGITQGALDSLTRDELQGVIAHEFSHIINGDMRLNMRLVSVLHGILVIALIGYRIMEATGRSRSSKDSGKVAFMGLGFVAIGYTGVFFGNLIKASVSRHREFLADASAVQFTRNNQGIANALKKVGGFYQQSYLRSAEANSFSHAFFSDAMKSRFSAVFSTHPPLVERVKRLDPLFRGKFKPFQPQNSVTTSDVAGVSAFSASPVKNFTAKKDVHIVDGIGNIDAAQVATAALRVADIPPTIKSQLYSPESAEVAIYSMLLAQTKQEEVLVRQLEILKTILPSIQFDLLEVLLPQFQALDSNIRLPILEIALPNLRGMSHVSYMRFTENMAELIKTDENCDLFEWTVYSIVTQYLRTEFEVAEEKLNKFKDFSAIETQVEVYIRFLLQQCCEAGQRADVLKKAGEIFNLPIKFESMDSANKVNLNEFDSAIKVLRQLFPKRKEQLLKLTYFIMTQDKQYCSDERELMRAICEVLGCPMPIFEMLD